MDKGKEVPAGSTPVSEIGVAPEKTDAPDKDTAKEKGEEKPLVFGKYKDLGEAERAFKGLESMMGSQSSEIGSLRGQTSMAMDMIRDLQGQLSQAAKSPDTREAAQGYKDTLKEITKGFRENLSKFGDADSDPNELAGNIADLFTQGLNVATQATRDETLNAATAEFKRTLAEKDTAERRNRFWTSNEGKAIEQFKQSGGLDEVRRLSENPDLEDDVTLYRLAAMKELSSKVTDLETQLAEAKKIAKAAGDGDDSTNSVFTKAGGDLSRPSHKPKARTEAEKDASALEAVRRARASGG